MGQVNLSEQAEKSLIAAMAADKTFIGAIADAVKQNSQVALLEELRQAALTQGELSQVRQELARRDQTIAQLEGTIAQLNQFVQMMSASRAPVPQQFNPYNNGGPAVTTSPVPVWGQHSAAQAPVPQQFAAPAWGAVVPEPTTPLPATVSSPAGS